jgi:hypothetical protein
MNKSFSRTSMTKQSSSRGCNINDRTHTSNANRKAGKTTTFSGEQRPSFLAGVNVLNKIAPQIKISSIRKGMGNRYTVRPRFIAPPIEARSTLDFDKMKALSVEQLGTKVSLSDATLKKLIQFQAPDPTDMEWIRERARLNTLGRPGAMPLGRIQRMRTKTINFGEATLGLTERISSIQSALVNGIASNRIGQQMLGEEIAKVLKSPELVNRDIIDLGKPVKELKIPGNWKDAGFEHQLWTTRQIGEPGMYSQIMLFILSNIPKGRTISRPVLDARGVDSVQNALPITAEQFSKILQSKGNNNVFDLESRTLFEASEIISAIRDQGFDDGYLDGLNYGADDVLFDAIAVHNNSLGEVRQHLIDAGELEKHTPIEEEQKEVNV